MIKVSDLHKIYGQGSTATHALNGVTLDIADGEFVAVMGRSGSGKSTLLHLLGLLDPPTSGGIRIEGVDVLALSDKERAGFRLTHLGYVFQEYSLVTELTALENVALPSLCCPGMQDSKKRAAELLDLVGLSHRLKHYPPELSGGEQQRVAIARALVNNPRTVFADEPCASLDAASSEMVLQLFSRLNKELGQTIIMVTHEPEDVKYVNRVISLKDGSVDKGTHRSGG